MEFLGHKQKKYLLLIPIAFLIFNAIYFQHAAIEIQSALLREKITEITNFVDMLTITVDADVERSRQGYEANIRDATEFIDKLFQVYGASCESDSDQVFYSASKCATSS